MSEFLLLLFNAALLNNLVLTHLLGLDLQVASSRRMQVAWHTGIVTLICITVSMPLARIIDIAVLGPLQLRHLDLLVYILLTVLIVSAVHYLAWRLFPLLVEKISVVLPLLLINTVLPGVMLLQQTHPDSLPGLTVLALANGLGFLLLLLMITCLRERIDDTHVPKPLRGVPLLLIGLGIFSMGLAGLTGIA